VVVHEPAWRQRTQRVFNGVPAEMFVNPVFQIRRQMASDAAAGRPVMAHMLATSLIVDDATDILASLQREARDNLAAGPQIDDERLLTRRYHLATGFEDAHDIRDADPDRAHVTVTTALIEAVNFQFLRQGRWLPHEKTMLSELEHLDPGLGASVRRALGARDLDERLARATSIIERIAGASGFFEWESIPESLTEP
jgi:hypothetical protein